MYAIIRAGGHQEKVSVGETITVDRLKQDPDSEIRFTPLLISVGEGNAVSDRKELEDKGTVVGRVIEHVRGDKIDVFHYRNKTGFRKHTGHRSMLTLVEITQIGFGDTKETLDDAKARSESAAAEKAEAAKALKEAKEKGKADRKTAQKKAAAAKKKTSSAKKAAPAKKKAAPAKKAAASKKKAEEAPAEEASSEE